MILNVYENGKITGFNRNRHHIDCDCDKLHILDKMYYDQIDIHFRFPRSGSVEIVKNAFSDHIYLKDGNYRIVKKIPHKFFTDSITIFNIPDTNETCVDYITKGVCYCSYQKKNIYNPNYVPNQNNVSNSHTIDAVRYVLGNENIPVEQVRQKICPHTNKYINRAGGKAFWFCKDCKSDLGDV